MASQFEDIKITGIDQTACSKPDPDLALLNIVLTLSAPAPSEWATYFNHRWERHIYMVKRRASVSGARLQIYCVPDELEHDHIPQLNSVIAETNAAYRNYRGQADRELAAQKAADARDRAAIEDLASRLKFE